MPGVGAKNGSGLESSPFHPNPCQIMPDIASSRQGGFLTQLDRRGPKVPPGTSGLVVWMSSGQASHEAQKAANLFAARRNSRLGPGAFAVRNGERRTRDTVLRSLIQTRRK